jgi:hypothetical protein
MTTPMMPIVASVRVPEMATVDGPDGNPLRGSFISTQQALAAS